MYKKIKKISVVVMGFTVVGIGVAMLVLPGPALIVIPAGLAILATEFVWAKKSLKRMQEEAKKINPFKAKS